MRKQDLPQQIVLIGGHFQNDLPAVQSIARMLSSKPGARIRLRRSNLLSDGLCTFELWCDGFTDSEWQEVVDLLHIKKTDLRDYSPCQ